MNTKFILFLFFTLYVFAKPLQAQEKKVVEALEIEHPLEIDAILDEDVYRKIAPATGFLQLQPHNGKQALQQSEVYFFYDQLALYLGAMLYDSAPDSIFNYISARDNIGMSDYFGVYIDPYNKGQLAFGFFVTPSGAQTDMKAIKKDWDREDASWDAVWKSQTRITDSGWVVEMSIPYAALRFPDNEKHQWGLNMFRNIRRYSSNNSWNFVNRNVSGFIHQQGVLTGIENIKPPVRLSLSPYISGYLENTSENTTPALLYKGGMDLKFGISESFTLDMMMVPDFGQVQSDDQELNLTPFELEYDEKRQFFNEGTELFQRADIFYSRRIGAAPKFLSNTKNHLHNNETILSAPLHTRLANASKISGRTQNGWGFGVLNAMSLPAIAEIKDTISSNTRIEKIQPFTNYNVSVIDKTLKNNSYISLINTNMMVDGSPFSANVTATDFQLRDKHKKYLLSGKGGVSYRKDSTTLKGGFMHLGVAKNSGVFNYGLTHDYIGKNYNPNDMGYLTENNIIKTKLYSELHFVEPFFIFREMHISTWYNNDRIIDPNDKFRSQIGLWNSGTFSNNYWYEMNTGVHFKQHDYFETRTEGRYSVRFPSYWYNMYLYTDNRKNVSVGGNIGGFNAPSTNEYGTWWEFESNLRAGQRLRVSYKLRRQNEINNPGYVDKTDNNDTIYYGIRNVNTLENKLELTYSATNALSVNLRARHYWSGVKYLGYYQLQPNGKLLSDQLYNENHNTNYNIFNIDMAIYWYFAPGSVLSFSWKNAIFEEDENVLLHYSNNIERTFNGNQHNSISVKILYYLDYNKLKDLNK